MRSLERTRLRAALAAALVGTGPRRPVGETASAGTGLRLCWRSEPYGRFTRTTYLWLEGAAPEPGAPAGAPGTAVVTRLDDAEGNLLSVPNASATSTATPPETVAYDGYGNVSSGISGRFGDRYRYTRRELDAEAGLQYNRARYYDPTPGRLIDTDPPA
jgi:RHS repeat-associated protein